MPDSSRSGNSGKTGPQVFDVELSLTVRVEVNDPLVLRRPIENIDGWRDDLYDLKTRDEVLHHLAFNCAVNGQENAVRLDGWADLPESAVSMQFVYATDLGDVYEHPQGVTA